MTEPRPDVEIAASARAKELRFECKPTVHIAAYANRPASAGSVSERENLPDEVEPGVTYEDIEVRWRLWARLEDPEGPEE
jgi:hypothetical protein